MIWGEVANLLGKGIFDGISGVIKTFVKDPTEALKAEAALMQLQLETSRRLAELETADRDSARKREMEVKDRTPSALAYGVTAGFFGLLLSLLVYTPPVGNADILYMMIGVLGTVWVQQMSYYYGTSTGSGAKNGMIDRLMVKLGNGNGEKK